MNSLNINLTGKVVVVKSECYHGDERGRRFLCLGGFGCHPDTMGTAVSGMFLIDGERTRIEGYEIEKLSDDQDPTAGVVDTKSGKGGED